MATRWNKRRLLATFVLMAVAGLLYFQHDASSPAPWEVQPGSAEDVRPSVPVPPAALAAAPQAPAVPEAPAVPAAPAAPAAPAPAPAAPSVPDTGAGAGAGSGAAPVPPAAPLPPSTPADDGRFHWKNVLLKHAIPRASMKPVPSATPEELQAIPNIQFAFAPETEAARVVRLDRLAQVKSNFTHAWAGYKKHAWMSDEVRPMTGGSVERFGGWAASLVDALDTLWIMDLTAEFEEAVAAIDQIDFTTTNAGEVNVFETTIRYLGGFLAAYDLSDGQYPSLLRKAIELGDMLYVAFDTPNHLPITRWKFEDARSGKPQRASKSTLVSEPGSLTVEFTRLSQLSGDPKYYDAVQRVMDVFADQQDATYIPGLWPVMVNCEMADFTGGSGFTIGGMADSLYEYLPKEYLMLGGAGTAGALYHSMYDKALAAMQDNIFFRPRTPSPRPLLFPGDKTSMGRSADPSMLRIDPRVQHLSCFAGGMVGLAARAFGRPEDMDTARQLVEGCLWAYENAPNGIMPEIMHVSACPREATVLTGTTADDALCHWNDKEWYTDVRRKQRVGSENAMPDMAAVVAQHHLTPGVTKYDDTRYILRPEAIESVFVLYRLTGDTSLLDRGWAMFEAIVRATKTDIAHAALNDCTLPAPRGSMVDSMESFWLAETLKYFYLLYADPDLVSLDEYVLNTEAHPLRRPHL